jgi:hypothetical protein
MRKFEVGKTYQVRALCDWDCIFSFVIRGRSAKTVSVETAHGIVRRKVYIVDGEERCMPLGQYSMAPSIQASREYVS